VRLGDAFGVLAGIDVAKAFAPNSIAYGGIDADRHPDQPEPGGLTGTAFADTARAGSPTANAWRGYDLRRHRHRGGMVQAWR
jgi:hypothetical protein